MKVKYLKEHGTSKAGETKEMHHTTARALAVHKIVELPKEDKPKEK
jgi:hypothetical protein